jgi:hypothetical protein
LIRDRRIVVRLRQRTTPARIDFLPQIFLLESDFELEQTEETEAATSVSVLSVTPVQPIVNFQTKGIQNSESIQSAGIREICGSPFR